MFLFSLCAELFHKVQRLYIGSRRVQNPHLISSRMVCRACSYELVCPQIRPQANGRAANARTPVTRKTARRSNTLLPPPSFFSLTPPPWNARTHPLSPCKVHAKWFCPKLGFWSCLAKSGTVFSEWPRSYFESACACVWWEGRGEGVTSDAKWGWGLKTPFSQ